MTLKTGKQEEGCDKETERWCALFFVLNKAKLCISIDP